jgi:type IV secretory pathway TrbD component
MTTLTKDEVRKLTPEQQVALGGMEVQRVQARQQLLKRARRGMSVSAGLLTGLAGGLTILSTAIPRALPFAIIAAIWLVRSTPPEFADGLMQ